MQMTNIASFQCSRCKSIFKPTPLPSVCEKCAGMLYVRYDFSAQGGLRERDSLGQNKDDRRWSGMWRYRNVLPMVEPVTLGEGWTPMLRSRRYENVFLKEEGANPTGSFKARGLALAVTMAKHFGLRKLAVPSAGNAAGGLARDAGAPDIAGNTVMPKH